MSKIRELAQMVADGNLEAAEFLDVYETAEAEEFDLTESELMEAYNLALEAKAVLPPDQERGNQP